MLPKPHLLNGQFQAANIYGRRDKPLHQGHFDLWKVSQKTEYLCLFALQNNLLLALKDFKKRGEKIHQLQKCLRFGVIKHRLQM